MVIHCGIDRGGFHQDELHCFGRCLVEFFRELYRPWHIGNASVEFSIDEVCQSAKAEPDWRSDDEVVADVAPGNLVPIRIPKRVDREHQGFPRGQTSRRP